MQKGVQEWKNRITVTTPPNAASEPVASTEQADDGCCSSNGNDAACCSSGANKSACGSTREEADGENATLPFSSLLCYGCLTNLRDLDLKSMGSVSGGEESSFELPPMVAEGIADRLGYKTAEEALARSTKADPRESLRAQIQEFLIDDGDSDGDEDEDRS